LNYYGNSIDGIILSHIHIDHSNDLNVFVEYMTEGGSNKSGTLLLPKQALEDRILYPYLKDFPKKVELLKEKRKYKLGNIEITTSVSHRHGVENYGFVLKTQKHRIGLVTDTVYFPELLDSYKDCDTLIINVPYCKQDKAIPKHLDVSNVEEFIKNNHPVKVILTHFNCNILDKNPENIAKYLTEKYNIEVIAAFDDMILEL
ncbi:MAG: MBL fold metallo-hydrolase, partial [Bacilli bacterium]|nr:MBL fold metallo-hydrolase [Bacilli bacterium]